MLRWSAIGALVALAFTSACARETPQPTASRHPDDIVLPQQSEIFEAVVPPHATLDGLLKTYDLPSDLVQAAVRSAG